MQARLKIKDLSCSLACPAGQTRPIDVSDFSNTSYSIILHLSVVLVLVMFILFSYDYKIEVLEVLHHQLY
jgi:hypothetical protein